MGDICDKQKHDNDVLTVKAFGTVGLENFNNNLDLMSRHSWRAVRGPCFNLAGRRSAEDSWMSCHAKMIASFCPHFHLRECILLPQNCPYPDSINRRCSSPHHISKLSGLHSDKYSSGNSLTMPHSESTCNHLWCASETNTKLYCNI